MIVNKLLYCLNGMYNALLHGVCQAGKLGQIVMRGRDKAPKST